jgi:DNA topoisomerase-3
MTPQAIRDGFDRLRSDEQMLRPGRRRAQPLRGRLAGGHQRHARDDGVQLARRRLLPHHRGPGADAHAVASWSSARRRSASTWRATTGSCAPPSTRRPAIRRQVVRPAWKKNPDDADRCAPTACGTSASAQAIAAAVRGQPASVTEEAKPSTSSSPLLYDLTTLQREANSRFGFRQDHAVARAGAVREAQGADLPADRLARTCPRTTWAWSRTPSRCWPARTCRARCASWSGMRARR